LKDKFSNNTTVNIDQFLQYAKEVLHMNLTSDSNDIESMRIALRSGDTIAYTTKGMHFMSLQMRDRRRLKDYVSPSSELSENSITALGKEIPALIKITS
jgi:hypothetical protein